MATPSERVIANLKAQLDDSRGYVESALRRGEALQWVLYMDSSGKVGRPKLTISGRDVDTGGRAALTSLHTNQ